MQLRLPGAVLSVRRDVHAQEEELDERSDLSPGLALNGPSRSPETLRHRSRTVRILSRETARRAVRSALQHRSSATELPAVLSTK